MLARFFRLFFVALLIFGSVSVIYAQDNEDSISWLLARQNENGGWSDTLSASSAPGITIDAFFALVAAESKEFDAGQIRSYLRDYTSIHESTLDAGLAAKLALVAFMLGDDVESFAGVNLLEVMTQPPSDEESRIERLTIDRFETREDNELLDTSPQIYWLGNSIYSHCLVMIAATQFDHDLPSFALSALLDAQNEDGGWGFDEVSSSDPATTATCLQALILQGRVDTVKDDALKYFSDIQNADGGWSMQSGSEFASETDSYASANVIIALRALKIDLAEWGNPDEVLLSMRREDGSFDYSPRISDEFDIFASTIALFALQEASLIDLPKVDS